MLWECLDQSPTESKGVLKHLSRKAIPGVTRTSKAPGQGWGRGMKDGEGDKELHG